MDHREHKYHQFQSLGICNKLLKFLKFIPTHVIKMLSSGRLMPRCIAQAPELIATRIEANSKTSAGQVVLPLAEGTAPQEVANIEAKTNTDVRTSTSSNAQDEAGKKHDASQSQVLEDNDVADTQLKEEEAPLPNSDAATPNKAPKKMVSINDNVETISISKKRSKKQKLQEADQPMPLKSILKVGSDLNNVLEPERLLSRANGA